MGRLLKMRGSSQRKVPGRVAVLVYTPVYPCVEWGQEQETMNLEMLRLPH